MNPEKAACLSSILVHELIPALGCTEPIAIAYCSACAADALKRQPERLLVEASSNIIKNVKSVIVPHSNGMKGIAASAILGALSAKPELKLQVLQTLKEEDMKKAKELEAAGFCKVKRLESPHPLHIKVHAYAGEHESMAEIVDEHTNLVYLTCDGVSLLDKRGEQKAHGGDNPFENITLRDIIDYAEAGEFGPAEETLKNQLATNRAISDEGLTHEWGAQIGRYHEGICSQEEFEQSVRHRAIAMASAGSDARMSGCDMPVVINSGSGNQGMTVSMPVLAYAQMYEIDEKRMLQALAMANLGALYQKSYIGRLSAFCGAVSAAVGSASAVAWMLGEPYEVVENTIKNALGTISGMVCDGAKPSCAAKISASITVALDGYAWAKKGLVFAGGDGIVKQTADQTIAAVGRMASQGMRGTDAEIIEIMLDEE